MKLKFKIQEYQTPAFNSVVDLFRGRGQEQNKTTFSVNNNNINRFINEYGIGNHILLDKESIEKICTQSKKKIEYIIQIFLK